MLLDFVFELEQFESIRCISLSDSWYDESSIFSRVFAEDVCGYLKPSLEAEFLHCVYSSLREIATFAVGSLRLVRGVNFDLLLLGTVLST